MRSTNNGIYNGRYQKESGDILLSFGKTRASGRRLASVVQGIYGGRRYSEYCEIAS